MNVIDWHVIRVHHDVERAFDLQDEATIGDTIQSKIRCDCAVVPVTPILASYE
jgi:hypothetical protein